MNAGKSDFLLNLRYALNFRSHLKSTSNFITRIWPRAFIYSKLDHLVYSSRHRWNRHRHRVGGHVHEALHELGSRPGQDALEAEDVTLARGRRHRGGDGPAAQPDHRVGHGSHGGHAMTRPRFISITNRL